MSQSSILRPLSTNDELADPCIMVIFGASGDLTKRLLMPSIYNLAFDGLLSPNFAIIGIAMDDFTSESFREKMSKDIGQYTTHKVLNDEICQDLTDRIHYTQGKFDDPDAYRKLSDLVVELNEKYDAGGNVLFYMATPPVVFGMVSNNLEKAGFKQLGAGWKRIIVEKPFGHDLKSAIELNKEILSFWAEDQVFRIDHYLGKETVQNILAFRFANGMYEPIWNKNFIDHIQFTVAEKVCVEGRGGYYDTSGVLRDMIQNHMFQMLSYLCMEVPISFDADAIRNEKAKLLDAVTIMSVEEVLENTVRGQYGAGIKGDGQEAVAYRDEPDVNPKSNTETFAALKLSIGNWRWEGIPIYIRSGKALWKKDTEIVVEFKKAPEVIFRNTPAAQSLKSNQLIFHIQPDQGIEVRFQAKQPGPKMNLSTVNMHFSYGDAFDAARSTGYEVMIYDCMIGNATLFSRSDLVEAAWKIAQPVLDVWNAIPATDFPNYPVNSWGPKSAFDLIERDGRRWVETISREVLEQVPLFEGGDPVFLHSLVMKLKPMVAKEEDFIIQRGDMGTEMYFINRGEVEVLDAKGERMALLSEGNFFGEISLLFAQERTASIRALSDCDLFVLDKQDFVQALKDRPQFAESIMEVAKQRYDIAIEANQLMGRQDAKKVKSAAKVFRAIK